MICGSICSIPVQTPQLGDGCTNVALGISIVALDHKSTPPNSNRDAFDLKQVHSTENMTSASIGHSKKRSVVSTHMKNCNGRRCKCNEICEHFLNDSDTSLRDFIEKQKPVINEIQTSGELSWPYMFVLVQGSEMIKISSSAVSFAVESLVPGSYEIRYS